MKWTGLSVAIVLSACLAAAAKDVVELMPPAAKMRADHPRLLVRAKEGEGAISLGQLRKLAATEEGKAMLERVRRSPDTPENAAMLALLTGTREDADAAVRALAKFKFADAGCFQAFFQLRSAALAYDWLFNDEGFSDADKQRVRDAALPLAQAAVKEALEGGAHCFHNYMHMDACGIAFAGMAFATEDQRYRPILEAARVAWNQRYYPAWQYLGGVPGEPMGYWGCYCFRPAIHVARAIDSAFGVDCFAISRQKYGDFLRKHLEYVVYATMPDLRFVRFGDSTDGPDGAATHEIADPIDAAADLCGSPQAAWFSAYIAKVRGVARYYQASAPYWFCWGGDPKTRFTGPPEPASRLFQTADGGGHAFLRAGWGAGDLVVAFRCTDHYGAHNHYDQGGFVLWRNGPLALDVGKYGGAGKKVRGPQQATECHNTLLIDGRGQRPVHGQSSGDVEDFRSLRTTGPRLATGKILSFSNSPEVDWVVGDFTDAYAADQAKKVCRVLAFLKPDTLVVVDLVKTDKPVQWLLHVPQAAKIDAESATFTTTNGKSGLTCRTLLPAEATIAAGEYQDVPIVRVSPKQAAGGETILVHVLRTGATADPPALPQCSVQRTEKTLSVTVGDWLVSVPLAEPQNTTALQIKVRW